MKITPIGSEEIYSATVSRDNFRDFPWGAGDNVLYVLVFEDGSGASDYGYHITFNREPGGVGDYIRSE